MKQLFLVTLKDGLIQKYRYSQIMLNDDLVELVMAERDKAKQMVIFERVMKSVFIGPAYAANMKIIREWMKQDGASIMFRG